MYSLVSGLIQASCARPELHVLIIGLDNAGKTSLLEQIKAIFTGRTPVPPERIPPTIGMNLGKAQISNCNVLFWDLGGQMKIRSIWEKYYGAAHAVIFVVDACDVGRFEEAKLTLDAVQEHDRLTRIPIVIFANKQDLPAANSPAEIALNFDVDNEPNSTVVHSSGSGTPHVSPRVFGVSAVGGDGIEEGVLHVIGLAREVAT